MKPVYTAGFTLSLVLLSSCGNTGEDVDTPVPEATLLLVQSPGQLEFGECPSLVDPTTAADLFSTLLSEGEATMVEMAETRVIEECSGAGGTHIVSLPIADKQRFWLGAHACNFGAETESFNTGVIVGIAAESSTLLQGDEGWCMNYPGLAEWLHILTGGLALKPDRPERRQYLLATKRCNMTSVSSRLGVHEKDKSVVRKSKQELSNLLLRESSAHSKTTKV